MELEPRANLQPRSKEIAGRVRRWFEFGAADFIVAPQPHETLSGPPSRIKHYQGVVLRSLEHIVLMSLSVRLRALRLYVTRFQFNASAARACHCTAYGVAHFARVSMKTITNTCDMRQRSWWQTSVEPSNSLYLTRIYCKRRNMNLYDYFIKLLRRYEQDNYSYFFSFVW